MGSWLASFAKPERNIRRNSSQRNRNTIHFDVPRKMARKPASSSNISHWKARKLWPIELSESRFPCHLSRHVEVDRVPLPLAAVPPDVSFRLRETRQPRSHLARPYRHE